MTIIKFMENTGTVLTKKLIITSNIGFIYIYNYLQINSAKKNWKILCYSLLIKDYKSYGAKLSKLIFTVKFKIFVNNL